MRQRALATSRDLAAGYIKARLNFLYLSLDSAIIPRTHRESPVANNLIRSGSLTPSWRLAHLLKLRVTVLCSQQDSKRRKIWEAVLGPLPLPPTKGPRLLSMEDSQRFG